MKVLLAGPGTGKTYKMRSIISDIENPNSVLVLSFTNATVSDLIQDLGEHGVSENNCMTLHKFAVKYNHDKSRHVLHPFEEKKLRHIAKQVNVEFDQICNFLSCTTFDQMILRFVSYAKANDAFLEEKLSDFDTVIIDEYQDFNPNEQSLIDLLAEKISDVYILGDDDQCIYDFKDASTERIITLHNEHESIEHEHKCYRCPDKVVEHATNLIQNNTKRVAKDWIKTGKDGDLTYNQLSTLDDVAEYVTNEIIKISETTPEEKVLILSPVGFAADAVSKKLEENGLQFTNYFLGKTPNDLIVTGWALRYLFGNFKYLNLLLLGYSSLDSRAKYYELIKKHYDEGHELEELLALLKNKLPESTLQNYESIDDALILPYFSELNPLYQSAEGTDVEDKLENLFRNTEKPDDKAIKLMTIHKSKGLGAEHVFMIGLTQGILPNQKRGADSIESQRRLFYVGMTRAKKALHLLCSIRIPGAKARTVSFDDFKFDRRTRLYEGKASIFIEELGLKN